MLDDLLTTEKRFATVLWRLTGGHLLNSNSLQPVRLAFRSAQLLQNTDFGVVLPALQGSNLQTCVGSSKEHRLIVT